MPYTSAQLAVKYLRYYRTASNSKGHGMHSPFVFDFILNVLNNKKHYRSPADIELLRDHLKKDTSLLAIEDLGAGSRRNTSRQQKVRNLARSSVKPKKYGQLLFRLVKHYQPQTIVELGTSLGITTAYLAKGNPGAQIVTIEGSEEIHERAKQIFNQLELSNITSLNGNFDAVLPTVLENYKSVDLAFIDGNHRYDPTVNYFLQLVAKANNNTILVFDDIHWSPEMEHAWETIKSHPSVRCTIDVFFLGFVFLRTEFKEKQHFTVRF